MPKRPLPDSEEMRSRKRSKLITRTVWGLVLIFGALLAILVALDLI